MAQQWYVKTRKGPAGPFSARKIRKLIIGGKLKPSAHVRIGEKKWKKAGAVRGLKAIFIETQLTKKDADSDSTSQIVAEPPATNELSMQTAVHEPAKTTPDSTSHLVEQRELAYTKQFGPFDRIDHPPGSDSPHIDVYVHRPTDSRPFNTLVTGGMSDHPMPVSESSESSPRCELLMYVHRVDDVHIELLRSLASQPHLKNTLFSYGTTWSNQTPPQPIFDGSALNHFVFMFPVIGTDYDFHQSVSIEGSPLQLLHVEPITSAERQFLTNKGLDAFLELLEKKQHKPLLDPERKCYVKKRWFGR